MKMDRKARMKGQGKVSRGSFKLGAIESEAHKKE